MVNIEAFKQQDGSYTIQLNEYNLNELVLALRHLNTKRNVMNTIQDKHLKTLKGEDYKKRNKKRKEPLNLVINDGIGQGENKDPLTFFG